MSRATAILEQLEQDESPKDQPAPQDADFRTIAGELMSEFDQSVMMKLADLGLNNSNPDVVRGMALKVKQEFAKLLLGDER